MNDDKNAEFYRGQTWDLLFERLKGIEQVQQEQSKKIDSIFAKINWMYGWAAGAGVLFTIIVEFVKTKIFKS